MSFGDVLISFEIERSSEDDDSRQTIHHRSVIEIGNWTGVSNTHLHISRGGQVLPPLPMPGGAHALTFYFIGEEFKLNCNLYIKSSYFCLRGHPT